MSVTADAARTGAIAGVREDYSSRFCPAAGAPLPPGGRIVALKTADSVRLRAAFWPARPMVSRGTVTIIPGRDGTKNEGRAGSIRCKSECGKLDVDVAVKNEALRDKIDEEPHDWYGRIITVRANGITKSVDYRNHSLFLPRMVEDCYRLDKTKADSLSEIVAQFNSAVKPA